MKRTLSIVLALIMALSLFTLAGCSSNGGSTPSNSSASGAGTEDDPWLCGATDADNVQVFVVNNELWVTGSGNMADFEDEASRPWNDVAADLDAVNVFDDITGIGANAFKGCGVNSDCFDVFLSSTIVTIGDSAFEGVNFCDTCIITLPECIERIGARAFADSTLTRIDFNGTPAEIAGDAFANVTAEFQVNFDSDWNDSNKLPYGGEITYTDRFEFAYEEDYGTDEVSGSGLMYIPDGEELNYTAESCEEGYHFVRWEVVSGDITIDDPTNPELAIVLTENVSVRIIFAAD